MITTRVLSCDPGLKNSAIFVADITHHNNELVSLKLVDSFMMTTTLTDVTDENRELLIKYCRKLKKKYNPELFIVERFQPRGGFLSASIIELVNQMIAIMCMVFNVNTKQVTAGSWKNVLQKKVNKVKLIDLKEMYKTHKALGPHRLDCALMCMVQFHIKIKHVHKFAFFLERRFRRKTSVKSNKVYKKCK